MISCVSDIRGTHTDCWFRLQGSSGIRKSLIWDRANESLRQFCKAFAAQSGCKYDEDKLAHNQEATLLKLNPAQLSDILFENNQMAGLKFFYAIHESEVRIMFYPFRNMYEYILCCRILKLIKAKMCPSGRKKRYHSHFAIGLSKEGS